MVYACVPNPITEYRLQGENCIFLKVIIQQCLDVAGSKLTFTVEGGILELSRAKMYGIFLMLTYLARIQTLHYFLPFASVERVFLEL